MTKRVVPERCVLRVPRVSMALAGWLAIVAGSSRAHAAPASTGPVVWIENSMTHVFPHTRPQTLPSTASRVSISLAGGECESFQIVVLAPPSDALSSVTVELSDLVSGENRITSDNIKWHQVGYVFLERLLGHPEMPDAGPGWWPDPLLPVRAFDVPPDQAQPIWITVKAPAGTKPGVYSGTARVTPRGRVAMPVGISARVYGFTLRPGAGHVKTTFCLMDGFLESVYGKPLHADLRRAYGDFLLQHRLNPDDISRTSPPAIADLRHYRDLGMNTFNVLNLVEDRGELPARIWSPAAAYTPQLKQQIIDELDPFFATLEQEPTLKAMAYIHGFDERDLAEFGGIIREYFGLAHARWGVPTLTTAHVAQDAAQMRDFNIDWLCPITASYSLGYDFAEAEQVRRDGLEVWSYVSCSSLYPYPNFLVDRPPIESRVLWWIAYQQKMDGFLYWGLNIWNLENNDTPIDPEADGPFLSWKVSMAACGIYWEWLHGDGRLLYAGKNGPIGSMRLANIRDGLEDYEYLWLLSEKAGSIEVGRRACLPVAEGLTSYTRNSDVLFAQRDAIAQWLAPTLTRVRRFDMY